MANVDLVDLIPILKAINSIKNQYKDAIETVETDFSLYPVLTQNFLDKSYNNGYVVGFRQCLSDYLGTSDGVEIDSPRSMREVVPATYESQSGDATYDTLTSIMNFCLQVRRNLKEILDLDTDLFELYPPQVLTLAQGQYVAGYNDGYLGAISYVEGLAVLPPTINSGNNIVTLTSPQENVPTLEMFYKKGSLDGSWIQYYKGDIIQILESESPVRIYAYSRIGSKNSSIASRIVDYNDFMMPTIEFNNNVITIYPNYSSDSPVKTKYKLSSWTGYNDFLDYDGLPIPITTQVTVWAYNYLGEQQSDTATRTCTPSESVLTRPATPTITFSSQNNVLTVSTVTPGCTLYYQKAGSGDGWVPYYGPVILAESGTYTAIAVKDGVESLPSESIVCSVSTSGGGVTPAQPVCVAPTVVCNNNKISVITSQSGVKLYLSNQGRTNYGSPDYDPANEMAVGEWYEYTGQVPISESGKYQAKAVLISDPSKVAYSVVTDCTYFAATPGSGSIPGGGSGSGTGYVAPPLMQCNDSVLTLSAVTLGSTVYYRESGTDTWLLYTNPITILVDWLWEAKAIRNGVSSSVTSLYCLTQVPVAPTISCTTDGLVSMTTPSVGASILYRVQGESEWQTFEGGLYITDDTTFEAKAVRNGYESSVTTHECEVYLYPVTGNWNWNTLTLSCATPTATIYYRVQGSTDTWTQYTAPIRDIYSESITYEARALNFGVWGHTEIFNLSCPSQVQHSLSGHTLTLSCNSPGVTIYYKAGESSEWTQYSSPLTVEEYNRYDFRSFWSWEDTNTYSQTTLAYIGTYCPTPQIGFESSTNTVTISVSGSVPYDTIQYRFGQNGVWTTYTNPFQISQTVTVEARTASLDGWYSLSVSRECEYNNIPMREQYFTVEAVGLLSLAIEGVELEYSTDNGNTWQNYPVYSSTDGTAGNSLSRVMNFYSGTKILFRHNQTSWSNMNHGSEDRPTWGDYGLVKFYTSGTVNSESWSSSGSYKVYGNILSLIYKDNFTSYTTVNDWYWLFMNMFSNTKLVDAQNLILPNNTTRKCCYKMFWSTNITTSPILTAQTLVDTCYGDMFADCSNLNYITCYATSGMSVGCTRWTGSVWGWNGVAANGTFVKKNGITWPSGVNGIPEGWNVVEV